MELMGKLSTAQENTLIQIANDYISTLVEASDDSRFITSKTMDNYQYLPLILALFPDAKIIHIKRDPMDNCFSIFKHHFISKHEYAYDLTELGHYYVLHEELMRYWHASFPGKIFDISYEDLVENQEKESRAMLECCGLPWDDACLSFHRNKQLVNTASSTQVRKPIYRSAIGFWHHFEKQLQPLQDALSTNYEDLITELRNSETTP